MSKRLTQLGVEKARHDPDRRVEVPDGNGLYLVLQPSGGKSWAFRYRRPGDGKPAKLTLGPVRILRDGEDEPADAPVLGTPLSLAQARWLSGQIRHGVAVKEDPAAKHKAAKQKERDLGDRNHFEVVAQLFLERYARRNTRASTYGETANLLGFAVRDGKLELRSAGRKHPRPLETWPALRWRGRRIQTITRRDIKELLDEIVAAGAPSASNGTLAAVRRLFSWAVEEEIVTVSPCMAVKKAAPLVERDRVLSDVELRLVWLAADKMGWPFGHLIKLLALTGARREEWAGAKWSEVDLKEKMFHLPKERSKNGLAHDIPLSAQAIAVLADLAKHRLAGRPDWLFTTGTGRATTLEAAPLRPISGYSKANLKLDATVLAIAQREEAKRAEQAGVTPEVMAPISDWRLHDLRRTTVTGMARLGVSLQASEKAINHISGSFAGVVRVYQRHDYAGEVRDAMERWGAAVERVVRGEPAVPSNVVPLRAGR
jgi:integrase